ncbi:MAG: terminase [Gammaproteobacteria bacterium]|nr:terminase [Gammaproteobacteria bacterium]
MTENYIETSHVFGFIYKNYLKDNNKKLFALEGSSGAGKTWGIIDAIIEYCRINNFEDKRVTIGRETYMDCLDTVGYDFIKRLKMIGFYDELCHRKSHPQAYFLFGNRIDFAGWSNRGQPSKRQDVLWFNEVLESGEEVFKQYNQRTNDITFADWNPKVTQHWVYDKILNRPDCHYLHCLMLDCPFLPTGQKEEILRYDPWAPGSYEVKNFDIYHKGQIVSSSNQPPPHPENIDNGTADEFMWKVYGLGLRASAQGIIFRNVEWIDEFPPDMHFDYGLDFGFTSDPTVITKNAEDAKNIWIEVLSYAPMETPEELHEYAKAEGIDYRKPTTADSSDKYTGENKGTVEMVKSLQRMGWNISKVKKNKSVMFWLNSMKAKKIHIVKNKFYIQAKKEQENYKMREINGILINQPVDKFNHMWDSGRYRHMSFNGNTGKLPFMRK